MYCFLYKLIDQNKFIELENSMIFTIISYLYKYQ